MSGLRPTRSKYSSGGLGWFSLITPPELVLPRFQNKLISALEATYAEKSWLQFKTVARKIKEVETQFGLNLELPWSLSQKLNFVMSCNEQNLKADSIKVYLSKVIIRNIMLGL